MDSEISPFLRHERLSEADSLAIIHLSRDNLLPVYLQRSEGEHDGYAEGAVLNIRYGSFPHSTLLDMPWGSQIRASKVDTGSRGRKRKRLDALESESGTGTPADSSTGDANTKSPEPKPEGVREAVAAASGFVHILPPTPELWTLSLPHRTQVVYTHDYAYILQKIRARPGSHIIEAGAGSGSFTHAAARAVYNGYPESASDERGKVFSFEFNPERYKAMTFELAKHKLTPIVRLAHRDVYADGFLAADGSSPGADAVFLDLPGPWKALPHLTRQPPPGTPNSDAWVSPLNPRRSVHICTFSPCIEQVSRTVSALRRLGWVEIEMVEVANRRVQAGRDAPAGGGAGPAPPRDVGEAVARLRDIEARFREHTRRTAAERSGERMEVDEEKAPAEKKKKNGVVGGEKAARKPWVEGQLVTRGEAEIKTHTSYLVFAILPREWSEEEEAAAYEKWPCGNETGVIGSLPREERKERKRQHYNERKEAKDKRRAA
jgi:tRNA (adenine57-N1/adenine58-N1)-methyltransferase catalytic subunit